MPIMREFIFISAQLAYDFPIIREQSNKGSGI